MPRYYVRKTDRQGWDKISKEKAIIAVNKNEMGWLMAAKAYGIPQATLRRHALKQNKMITPTAKGMGRCKSVSTPEIERELVEHIKLLETRLFGFTRREVLELAYQFAEANNVSNNFNKETKMAGKEWLAGFRRRNPDISLRKPEATSAARAQAFNRPQVARFFNTYQNVIETYKIPSYRLYNIDESALSTVQRPQKVFATTGRKQVGALTSAEKGSHVTVVCCMSANGHYIPLCLIYPRKLMKQELIDEAPAGTLVIAQESGWMTTAVFYKWLMHFQTHVKASLDDKVLLIVDGHISLKEIESLKFAKDNGIILLCLPPHCTHRMQPLDVSFYGPLKTYFNQEVTSWLKNHPGRVVTVCITQIDTPTPVVSRVVNYRNPTIHLRSTTSAVPVSVLSPVPKGTYVAGQGKRKPPKKVTVLLLTSTPNKEEVKSKSVPPPVAKKPKRKVKKMLNFNSSSEEDFGSLTTNSANNDDEDCACIYCNDLYSRSKPKEIWLKCMTCGKWAHASCADVPKKTKYFICELCK
ncbi:hypothetical protein K1T71_004430 [Dendrolimus kikuchii]|uniref:Uncharacterized protein n=1 Tax=Dendrolimus kikuchii TaxID=765133 RepID=A0ACC1D795_9NEOP|nr:hypothetical protein K1T71_004430 [Dendrolimus kikuchii]